MDEKVREFAKKKGIEVHFLPEEAGEDGPFALCDIKAGVEESSRETTLAHADRETVTCPECRKHMEADG